jgi:hypothetical protein
VVTEAALQEFARRFEGQIPGDLMLVIRALFWLGLPEDDDDDDALLSHGGAAALDLGGEVDANVDVDV